MLTDNQIKAIMAAIIYAGDTVAAAVTDGVAQTNEDAIAAASALFHGVQESEA